MDRDRRARVDSLLEEALSLASSELEGFLTQACAGDEEVRREVSSLLRCHERAGSFLESPLGDGVEGGSPDLLPPMFHTGQVVSERFEILGFLGRGGMGEVYAARDRQLEETVALKAIRAEFASDPKAIERFSREVRLARRITHPNVCRVHELFRGGSARSEDRNRNRNGNRNEVFLSMEFLPGESLAARLDDESDRRLDWKRAVPILCQIASALEAAASAGVVHRDLKPENVMLVEVEDEDEDGRGEAVRAVVTDFGLAVMGRVDEGVSPPVERGTECPGTRSSRAAWGTPSYMSPEQLRGKAASHRSDLFSFGVVAYETLTGTIPYPVTNGALLARRFDTSLEPLRRFEPSIPTALQKIIQRCLAVDPKKRPKDATDLRKRLESIPTEVPRRRLALAATLSAVGCGVLAAKSGPAVLHFLQDWPTGPKVLPLEELVPSSSALASLRQGLSKVREGANLEAIDDLKRVADELPKSPLVLSFLLDAFLNVGEGHAVDELKAPLRAALERHDEPTGDKLAAATLDRAEARYARAAETLCSQSARYPDDVDLLLRCARVFEEKGDIPLAMKWYEGTLSRSACPAAELGLARCWAISGHLEQCASLLSDLLASGHLRNNPEALGMAYSVFGVLKKDQGQLDEAVQLLETSLSHRKTAGDRRGQVAALSHLGACYRALGRLENSIRVLEQALVVARSLGDGIYESLALHHLAEVYDASGESVKAIKAERQSLAIELSRNDDTEIPQRLNVMARFLIRRGQCEEAEVLLRQARNHTRRSGDHVVEYARLSLLADLRFVQGRWDEAVNIANRERLVIQDINPASALAANIILARLYDSRGQHAVAEQTGLEVLQSLRNTRSERHLLTAMTWYSRHLVQMGRLEGARNFMIDARKIASRLFDLEAQENLAVLDATISVAKGAYDSAATELEQCLGRARVFAFSALATRCQLWLGRVYGQLGRGERAQALLEQSEREAVDQMMDPLLARVDVALSELLLESDQPVRARMKAHDGIEIAKRLGARPILRGAYSALAEATWAVGRAEESLGYLRTALVLHGQILADVPSYSRASYLDRTDVLLLRSRAEVRGLPIPGG